MPGEGWLPALILLFHCGLCEDRQQGESLLHSLEGSSKVARGRDDHHRVSTKEHAFVAVNKSLLYVERARIASLFSYDGFFIMTGSSSFQTL